MNGDDVCAVCKGSGEVEAYLPHPSGNPELDYPATVGCYECGGTGEPPSTEVGVNENSSL